MPRLSVVGCGYLGVTHAACMAEIGYEVLGVDVDETKINLLRNGVLPFYEPGLAELLERHVASGRLRFTGSYREVAEFADVHFLCVNTPQSADSDTADLSHLNAAVATLAPLLRQESVVVGKSTVPVGTAARLAAELPAHLAWNPEFLREGHAIADTLTPDRLVVGATSEWAEKVLAEVYAPLVDAGVPLVVTDLATAELIKTAANAFLATKISFVNAMAEVCEAVGADVTSLTKALSYDPRIGDRFLASGLGFGGGCLPKDLRGFAARARELGVGDALSFLHQVDAINLRRREKAAALVREQCGGSVAGRRIAVLGGAFKPDSDDIRDSPALHVACELHREGGVVTVYDPRAGANIGRVHPELGCAKSMTAACTAADVVLVATEWDEFRHADPEALVSVVAQPCVVDARNALDADLWRQAGWRYRALGRS